MPICVFRDRRYASEMNVRVEAEVPELIWMEILSTVHVNQRVVVLVDNGKRRVVREVILQTESALV